SAIPFELEPPIDVEDQCNDENSSHGASSTDCQVYYVCTSPGVIIRARCGGETIWSPNTALCEHPEDALNEVCGWEPVVMATDDAGTESGRPRHPRFRAGFRCADGSKMIPFSSQCNGKKNCSDGSDEEGCAEPCDPEKCKLPGIALALAAYIRSNSHPAS
ncbi:PREDICTED: sortilin-related receptor-like, partial [Priapulus caudatus]|uniref:Sortilin-related receptor-like n=1 Tax=Priapulus caudatus TaxID=37621 RepID=A0ABM1EX51_PRICU